jgi:hypothetical protein
MENEFIGYAITAVIGLFSGYFSAQYQKFKQLISVLDKALEDDKISGKEIEEIIKTMKR